MSCGGYGRSRGEAGRARTTRQGAGAVDEARARADPLGTQRLGQIRDQIRRVLESHGQAQQVLRRFCLRSFDRGAVLDEAVRSAKTSCAREQTETRGDRHGLLASTPDLKR